MGNSHSRTLPESVLSEEDAFYYANRSEEFVLMIKSTRTEKLCFNQKVELSNKSAMCELSPHELLIAGGCSIKDILISKCFIINFLRLRLISIAPLPFPCKFGQLLLYKEFVYYVGGVTEDIQITNKLIPSPIMRFNIKANFWEVLTDDNLEFNSERLKLADLMEPGAFILSGTLYLFGGYLINQQKPNTTVVSLDLDKESMVLKREPFQFLFGIHSPVSGANSQVAYIAGGKINGAPSSDVIEFTVNSGFKKIYSSKLCFYENYPMKITEEYCIIFCFPVLLVKFKNSIKFFTVTLSQNSLESQVKMIEIDRSFLQKPTKYRTGKLSVDFDAICSNSLNLTTLLGSSVNLIQYSIETVPSERVMVFHEDFFQDKALSNYWDMIISNQNNDTIELSHRVVIKFIRLASATLNMRRLSALDLNQISVQLGFRSYVSVTALNTIMHAVLYETEYQLSLVFKLIQCSHKIFNGEKIKLHLLHKLLERMNIVKGKTVLDKEKTITLISWTTKAIIIKSF